LVLVALQVAAMTVTETMEMTLYLHQLHQSLVVAVAEYIL
jgi:hypothetical protein